MWLTRPSPTMNQTKSTSWLPTALLALAAVAALVALGAGVFELIEFGVDFASGSGPGPEIASTPTAVPQG